MKEILSLTVPSVKAVFIFSVLVSHGHAGESPVKDHDKEDEAPL